MFIQGEKLTSDTGDLLSFWAHRQLAREYYGSSDMILHAQFDKRQIGGHSERHSWHCHGYFNSGLQNI
jgi:hypothetical protein